MRIFINDFQIKVLLWGSILTTLIVSPAFSYDPINLPKMLVLVVTASLLIVPLTSSSRFLWNSGSTLVILSVLFCAFLLVAFFSNSASSYQQFFGIWGRSTGLLTYFSLIVILLTAAKVSSQETKELTRKYFERLSYFLTLYTILQAADLDPINWSQKLMIATLGNINFMSSFLGLATISMISRIIVEKSTFTSAVHYLTISCINLWLIWFSGSIQGLAIIAAGSAILITFKIRRGGSLIGSFTFLGTVTFIGGLVLVGTMGFGPFSALRQETVVFRIDYWTAGLRMTLDNLFNGVGIDSYGDYYEQYRDLVAVTRTGPQRVTNTAHNVFLDVSTGSGIITGMLFASIFLVCFIKLISTLRNPSVDSNDISIAAMFVGFIVFSMISINQIGVGVWGFLFMGLFCGKSKRGLTGNVVLSRSKANNGRVPETNSSIKQEKELSLKILVATLSAAAMGFIIAALPNVIDIRALDAVRNRDFVNLGQIATSTFSSSFYRDKYQSLLIEAGRDDEALGFARSEVKRDSRNDLSWRIIAFSEIAPHVERLKAIDVLRSLDPLNQELLLELKNLESTLNR